MLPEWFRSADMLYVSLILNEDAAHSCVSELGSLGCVQFNDLNTELTPFQRRYVGYIKRCDELERKLRFFNGEIENFGLATNSPGSVEMFVDALSSGRGGGGASTGGHLLEVLETELERHEAQLLELNSYSEKLTQDYNEKVEYHECLEKGRSFFASEVPLFDMKDDSADAGRPDEELAEGLLGSDFLTNASRGPGGAEMKFANILGVVRAADRLSFERMLFRQTRGNCYVRFQEISQPITDPASGALEAKLVFIVFYKSTAIEGKIQKICDAFHARRYPCPDLDSPSMLSRAISENMADLTDARAVLLKNRELRHGLCTRLAQRLKEWTWTVVREKSIYHTLNSLRADVSGMLRGEGWVVASEYGRARAVITKSHADMDLGGASLLTEVPKPWPTPPTHFKMNKFTVAYQEFVNTYGIPRYKEANPALFTAVTFPFLFGVMYGDIGHGTCVALGGLFLILTAKRGAESKEEMVSAVYTARYMLFMMGCFGVYAGLLYNDCFALGMNLFGSTYTYPPKVEVAEGEEKPPDGYRNAVSNSDYGDPDNVYPFGIDPAWHIASNELLFFNSFKMKMSVILGITQMTFGILLKGCNCLYFRDWFGFLFEFVPMIVFDVSMFGYMVAVIFIKWSINWQERMGMATCNMDNGPGEYGLGISAFGSANYPDGIQCQPDMTTADRCPYDMGGEGDGCQPPNLITTLINIVLKPGNVVEPMFETQVSLQGTILTLIFICVPVLLFGKPLAMRYAKANKHADSLDGHDGRQLMGDDDSHGSEAHGGGGGGGGGGHGDHDDVPFSEVMIHQGIETIEFVIGMVSNTASYLRLWALSLAHTELATVFWEKAMLVAIQTNNPIAVFIGYGVFAAVTFGVLLAMDVLECFLHALRLHWVEFQNKFYAADGYRFEPFDVKALLVAA